MTTKTTQKVPIVDKNGDLAWVMPDEARERALDHTIDIGASMTMAFMEGVRQALIDSTEGMRRAQRRGAA